VLAKVGDQVITVKDFEKEIASLPDFTRKQMQSAEQKRKRLERMIDEAVLLQEAKKKLLDQDEEIKAKLERYRSRLITEKLYQVVAQERASVDEAEILSYYEKNKDQFTEKERIRARQILILLPPNAAPEKAIEAEAKAKEAHRRAKSGEDFAELAKQFSDAPDPQRAGDLGYFSRGRMPPELEEVAFALQNAGDVSEVVRSKLGYHVIQLTDRQPAKEQPLEEVRDRIVRVLKSQKMRELRQSLAGELRANMQIEIDESFLKEEPAPAAQPTSEEGSIAPPPAVPPEEAPPEEPR
jgi:parvulin-like peptidyl-prolyl isomerase